LHILQAIVIYGTYSLTYHIGYRRTADTRKSAELQYHG